MLTHVVSPFHASMSLAPPLSPLRLLQAQADGGPTGSKDKQGKDVLMYYVFSPSSKARRDANEHCRKARRALKKSAVGGHVMACFEAKGLSVARGGAEVWPLFMDFDDLMEAWEAEREARPDMPAKPEVEVVNAMDLVAFLDLPPPKEASSKYQEAHRAYQAMFKNYGLVPASRNMDMIKGIKAKGKSRARLHVRM